MWLFCVSAPFDSSGHSKEDGGGIYLTGDLNVSNASVTFSNSPLGWSHGFEKKVLQMLQKCSTPSQ